MIKCTAVNFYSPYQVWMLAAGEGCGKSLKKVRAGQAFQTRIKWASDDRFVIKLFHISP